VYIGIERRERERERKKKEKKKFIHLRARERATFEKNSDFSRGNTSIVVIE
jgi:hypothetical protein